MASWINGVYHAAPCYNVNGDFNTPKSYIAVPAGEEDSNLLHGLGYIRDPLFYGCTHTIETEDGPREIRLHTFTIPNRDMADLREMLSAPPLWESPKRY